MSTYTMVYYQVIILIKLIHILTISPGGLTYTIINRDNICKTIDNDTIKTIGVWCLGRMLNCQVILYSCLLVIG